MRRKTRIMGRVGKQGSCDKEENKDNGMRRKTRIIYEEENNDNGMGRNRRIME